MKHHPGRIRASTPNPQGTLPARIAWALNMLKFSALGEKYREQTSAERQIKVGSQSRLSILPAGIFRRINS